MKFVVFKISFHLRGSDEKEVLSNDITCEEAVHLQQFEILHLQHLQHDWDSSIWRKKITEQPEAWTPNFYLKSFVMDLVQAGKFDSVQPTSLTTNIIYNIEWKLKTISPCFFASTCCTKFVIPQFEIKRQNFLMPC